jgi:hypothetical protein
MSNAVTRRYLDLCAENRGLRRLMDRAALPEVFSESYRPILLARPIFARRDRIERFAADLAEIFRLLVSLPGRLFDGQLDRYCAAAGIDHRLAALMTRAATGSPPLFGRSDAYDDGSAYRLLEFNVGTELGGMDFAELNRALLGVPAFADFAEREGLGYVDTADIVAGTLREVALTGNPVVVLTETPGGIAAHPNYRSVREAMALRGIDFRLGEVQDFRFRNGRLFLGDAAIDVVLRFYAAGEILECPYGPEVLDPIFKAVDAGTTVLFTSLENSLYNTKGGLALLSDDRFRDAFTASERQVIERVVPWTRMLTDDRSLIEQCRERRADLILKPAVGWGAAGAALGRDMTDGQWHAALLSRAGRGHVAQAIVEPVPEPVLDPGSGHIEDWQPNWGVYVTARGYAGSFVRTLRKRDGRVITFANKGTRGTCVFTYEAATEAHPMAPETNGTSQA